VLGVGGSPCGYSYQSFVGASVGLVTVLDTFVVDVWSSMSFRHVFVIKGRVILTDQEFIIVNVYDPCDTSAKQVLWAWLTDFVLNNSDANLCVCDEFNSVRSADERRGRSVIFRQVDADNFKKFIDDFFLYRFSDLWPVIYLVSRRWHFDELLGYIFVVCKMV